MVGCFARECKKMKHCTASHFSDLGELHLDDGQCENEV